MRKMKGCSSNNVVQLAPVISLLLLVLVATSVDTKQKAANAGQSLQPTGLPAESNWFGFRETVSTSTAAPKKKKVTPGCDLYGNCTNCFCDSLCRRFDDCCSSYASNMSGSLGDRGSRLPPDTFACLKLSGFFDYNDSYDGPIYVVNQCPISFATGYVQDACRRGSNLESASSDHFYTIPVSSRSSGLVYRNMYCALCHGEQNVTFWRMTTRCNNRAGLPGESSNNSASESNDGNPAPDSCETVYKSPGGDQPRRCVDSIKTCSSADAKELNDCLREDSTLYVYAADKAFRNKHCAACNGYDASTLTCSSTPVISRHQQPSDTNTMPFSVILDINTGYRYVSGETPARRQHACPGLSVYDPFAAICRPLMCSSGQTFDEDGLCRPIVTLGRSASVDLKYRTSIFTSANLDSQLLCPLISLSESEYEIHDNGSLFVPLHGKLYEIGAYRVDIDTNRSISNDDTPTGVVQICSPFAANRNETQLDAPTLHLVGGYLSLICSIVSLVALVFQFIVYMMFSVLRNRPGQLVLCLVVSLFVGQLLFLLANKSSGVVCYMQAVLMHFAYLAAFLWMNVMSIDVYRTFGSSAVSAILASPSSGSKRFVIYSLYAWGLAGLIVGAGILLDLLDLGGTYRPQYAGQGTCWFGSRLGQVVFFAVPLGVILLMNIGLFFGSVIQIHRASKATRVAVQKPANISLLMIYAKLSVVMGLGWMIGFLATFTELTALWYIFIVCNSLQGAFICLAFIVTKQVVRLLRERCRCCLPLAAPHGDTTASATSVTTPSNTKTSCV